MMNENDYITSNSQLFTAHGKKKKQGYLMWINNRLALGYVKSGEYYPQGFTYIDEIVQKGMSGNIPRFDEPFEFE